MCLSFSLRTKLVSIFVAMTLIVLASGTGMLWYSYQIDTILDSMVKKELVLYKAAQDMELALANQKGFLTYYFVDGDSKWIKFLGQYRQVFKQSLDQAATLELTLKQKEILNHITREYNNYVEEKDTAIERYKVHSVAESISSHHEKQRDVFFNLLELCRTFRQKQWQTIQDVEISNSHRSEKLRAVAYTSVFLFMLLFISFLFILYKQILGPIRGLAIETGSSPQESSRDEVVSLSHSLKDMMKDIDETHDELAKSRRHLLQAERMAMVGELAAGVAHTIRNPFTSIKMRMFSLTRSLDLSEVEHEDLKVISDEIGRIDKIVQNFLEFARPPKLKLEKCCLGELINSSIILLKYRLKKYNAELIYDFRPEFPDVNVDSDRIKEALLNLITNACQAMETGGKIYIVETREHDPVLGDIAVIAVRDTGPGIPENIKHKITTPFFTTKEDGSGLGLSIVTRIAREHSGKLIVSQTIDQGAEFILKIPTKKDAHESDTDN